MPVTLVKRADGSIVGYRNPSDAHDAPRGDTVNRLARIESDQETALEWIGMVLDHLEVIADRLERIERQLAERRGPN